MVLRFTCRLRCSQHPYASQSQSSSRHALLAKELGSLEPRGLGSSLLDRDGESQSGGPKTETWHAQQCLLAEQGRTRGSQSGGRYGHQRSLAKQGRTTQFCNPRGLQSSLGYEGRCAQCSDGRSLQALQCLFAKEWGTCQSGGPLGLQCCLAEDDNAG